MRPVCAISIDVDPIPCYYRIHALGEPPARLRDRVLHSTLPRFAEIFERRGIAATFFVVAEDLDADAVGEESAARSREIVRGLHAAGHEIGSHSYSHPYDLARLDGEQVRGEIESAHRILSDVIGEEVRGFRAPGYDLSPVMLEELIRLGYVYDSSIFPAPGYYAAKAVVMGAMRLVGMKSGAVLTNPRALMAPAEPYRPSERAPWRRGDAPIVELPVAVTPWTRIPAIGTSLLMAPDRVREYLVDAIGKRPLFNFELHGIDLADAEQDELPAELVAVQPDLRKPFEAKRAALEAVIDQVAESFDVMRLAEVAERF